MSEEAKRRSEGRARDWHDARLTLLYGALGRLRPCVTVDVRVSRRLATAWPTKHRPVLTSTSRVMSQDIVIE